MCGITGAVWQNSHLGVTVEQLNRMTDSLQHRGPDAAGHYFGNSTNCSVALGHRRLSIIDVQHGAQPLANEDGTIHVAFNGEIFNYRELMPDLQARGHRFKSECDTEVLVHLYEEHGPAMLEHLRGMFAFAIWDERRGRLFVARDRFGQKPLYYRADSGQFAFASELKALLQLFRGNRQLNPEAIDRYLSVQYVPQSQCMLQGFQKLPPGHFAVWEQGELTLEEYWRPPFPTSEQECRERETKAVSFNEACQNLRETLTEAVRLRLRSDVPLGAFLSGGIDSTIIAALAQRELGRPLQTFSIGFPHPEYDETEYARMAAAAIGTDHHEEQVEPAVLDLLPRLVWHYDEPFADSSAVPTFVLSEMTRRSVTVALTGDGGDELFAGYDRYRAVQLASYFDQIPQPFRGIMAAQFWQKLPSSVEYRSFSRRLKRFQASASQPPTLRYLEWISQFKQQERNELYTPEFQQQVNADGSREWLDSIYRRFPVGSQAERTTAVDQLSYLPGDILTKVDIASMACGLECRSPFLDHRVGELAARLPFAYKRRGRLGKVILREAFRDVVPEPILNRPKMGFGVPIDHWFRNELRGLLDRVLLSERCLSRGYFRPEAIRQLVDQHAQKQRDHAYRLWSLLIFEVWQRIYVDADPPLNAPDARLWE